MAMGPEKNLYFVGPTPPPLGGVAVMNMNVQRLMKDHYAIHSFNTSSGSAREDLYGRKGLREALAMLRMLASYVKFLAWGDKTAINIFITSRLSFVRDIFFITFARIFGYRIIIHLHAKAGGEAFVEGALLNIFSFFVGTADVILALSENHKEFFGKYIDNRKIYVLENFVFIDDFLPIPVRVRMDFLYIGRLTVQKGFFDLLDALTEIKKTREDFSVHVIGVAETQEQEDFVRRQIDERNLNNIITLYGAMQGAKKFDLFRRCATLIFPSHLENSPVVAKEGLMAKQAIIYSEIKENLAILAGKPLTFGYRTGDALQLKDRISHILDIKDTILELQVELNSPIEFSDSTALGIMTRAVERDTG